MPGHLSKMNRWCWLSRINSKFNLPCEHVLFFCMLKMVWVPMVKINLKWPHLTIVKELFSCRCRCSSNTKLQFAEKKYSQTVSWLIWSNICKATTVTHTKRIYRNLLRKETSFVYYTSSVLRKSPRQTRWVILSVRSAEWPLRSGFVEQCCSCVQWRSYICAKFW